MIETNGRASHPPVLEARELTKRFRLRASRKAGIRRGASLSAVDGVSLVLRAGYAVALVGESGSGKSTVARLLARLTPMTAGQVILNGAPVRRHLGWGRRAYAGQVQLILQDPFASLNPLHTIRYHLSRALKIHRRATSKIGQKEPGRSQGTRCRLLFDFACQGRSELQRLLDELLERVQLTPADQFLDKFPHELSGGQLQRVAIARALAAAPAVLLADEPVSMLDVSIRLGVLNLLGKLKAEERLALLYITHDIASARYLAEETLVMYRGELVEGGPSEDVTQRPAHPYTQLLISSAPDPARRGATEPPPAAGIAGAGASGCRFAGRCPHAMQVCTESSPIATDLGGGHWARCWLLADARGQRTGG